MLPRLSLVLLLVAAFVTPAVLLSRAPACCTAPPYRSGDQIGVLPVVNADQSVI